MEIIYSRNVNDAYKFGLERLINSGEREASRAGPVIVMPTPVVNVYNEPTERVLFNAQRDANPFFHIVEAVWMIAGWDDATVLDQFVGDFSSRFAEDNGRAHGAYGWRWRQHFQKVGDNGIVDLSAPMDQIVEAGRLLRQNPESRQVVMAMWDPSFDLGARKRDIPCNDLVMFRAHRNYEDDADKAAYRLDMSIVARSHDAVWGAYGANYVHMTVMHEVVAALANMTIGKYTHFSNNFHVYEAVLPKVETKKSHRQPYPILKPQRICYDFDDATTFIDECETLTQELKTAQETKIFGVSEPENLWLRNTVIPMIRAHRAYKAGDMLMAISHVNEVRSDDWATAGQEWLQRRQDKSVGAGAFA